MTASADPVGVATPFRVIAHRGASAHAPENTLPAFEVARALGAPEVELDVQLTRDGVVMLFHDAGLDEKTNLTGAVRDHDAAALAAADIGHWFDATHPEARRRFAGTPLVSLDVVFARFGDGFAWHVELKSEDAELPARVVERVRVHGLHDRVTLTSFHEAQLRRTRELAPEIPLTWLLKTPEGGGLEDQRRLVDRARALGFERVGFRAAELSPALVRHAQAAGLEIRAWKVSSPELMERAIRAGANGMTIDWPERLLHRLDELGAGPTR